MVQTIQGLNLESQYTTVKISLEERISRTLLPY